MVPSLTEKWKSREVEGDVFGVRISDDGSLVGCALSDGQVGVYSYKTGRLSYLLEQSADHFPTTSLRFNARDRKSLISVSADGQIREWSTHKFTVNWTVNEAPNQIFSLDLSPNRLTFATAGLDKIVRLYDYESQTIKATLQRSTEFGDETVPGHTNRIFSLLFHPTDSNLMLSGGWDDSIQVWDLRVNRSIRSIFGAHICADALDVSGSFLLSGSWRTRDQVQIWDMRNFGLAQTLKWDGEPQCLVYAAKFLPGGAYVVAGGSGANQLRVISRQNPKNYTKVQFEQTVYAFGFTKDAKEIVVGTQKGGVHCFQLSL
jgi:WD40 repeat protein